MVLNVIAFTPKFNQNRKQAEYILSCTSRPLSPRPFLELQLIPFRVCSRTVPAVTGQWAKSCARFAEGTIGPILRFSNMSFSDSFNHISLFLLLAVFLGVCKVRQSFGEDSIGRCRNDSNSFPLWKGVNILISSSVSDQCTFVVVILCAGSPTHPPFTPAPHTF